jgi:hypothetical protein
VRILVGPGDLHRPEVRAWLSARWPEFAGEPAYGIRLHGVDGDDLIGPFAVEHSNVRSSNPRVPGEIRASAILCLHTGHIGRSLIASPITLPQDHRQRTCCSLIM